MKKIVALAAMAVVGLSAFAFNPEKGAKMGEWSAEKPLAEYEYVAQDLGSNKSSTIKALTKSTKGIFDKNDTGVYYCLNRFDDNPDAALELIVEKGKVVDVNVYQVLDEE